MTSTAYLHRRAPSALLAVLLVSLMAGCAGWQANRDAEERFNKGDYEGALAKLEQATKEAPDNLRYRQAYAKRKESTLNELLSAGQRLLEADQPDQARAAYQRALTLDPSNAMAQAGLQKIDQALRHANARRQAQQRMGTDPRAARTLLEEVLRENPADRRAKSLLASLPAENQAIGGARGFSKALSEAFRKRVTLEVRDASLQQVFDIFRQTTQLNFMFDRDVRTDVRISASLTNKPFEDVLKLILAGQRLERKVLDQDTLLIYPSTPDKLRDYQDLVIRTFYLGNADATKAVNMARNIAKIRDAQVDERLNLLVVRDTPEQVLVLEKLLRSLDAEEPEVMLELEVLEVAVSKLRTIGINYPDALNVSVRGANGTGTLTLPEWQNRGSGLVNFSFANPLMALNLKQTAGDNSLLANPRIRIKNRQTAKVLVGEKVPVVTTIATANVGTSESISYLDVGLKLDLEPVITIDDEVSMKVSLEVSNIVDVITRASGLQAYRLGTRSASTTLRVRDGETQILAGLIQMEDRRSSNGIPGAADIPLLGRLFSSVGTTDSRTEIILLITPRVVRNVSPLPVEALEIPAGTENASSPALRSGSAPAGAPTFPFSPDPQNRGVPALPPGNAGPTTFVPTPANPFAPR